MTKFLFGAAALALFGTVPASAQLLGGGGGALGGTLGGGLGGIAGSGAGRGDLGGTVSRPSSQIDDVARGAGSARGSKQIDRRSGRVSASGDAEGAGTADAIGNFGGRNVGASGSGSGRAGGSLDTQLVGTDFVRGSTRAAAAGARERGQMMADQGRAAAGATRQTGGSLLGTANGSIDGAGSLAGSASGMTGVAGAVMGSGAGGASGSSGTGANPSAPDMPGGMASGFGQLALAGSAAASGYKAFDVTPGMTVTDAKGRVIGTVRDLRTTSEGYVRQVVVAVGDRVAALPATNFSGSGSVLVSAMGKGDVREAAEDQTGD